MQFKLATHIYMNKIWLIDVWIYNRRWLTTRHNNPFQQWSFSNENNIYVYCSDLLIFLWRNNHLPCQLNIELDTLKWLLAHVLSAKWQAVARDWNLTHWGRDKMAAIFQTTFSNEFLWMKMYEFRLSFHWSLFLGFQLTIFQHWFRQWLGAGQATSHYLN